MSYFDIGLLVILAIFIFHGFKNGLIKLLGQVVGLILASYIASHFYLTFYAWGQGMVHLNEGTGKFLAFVILFVVISSLAGLLFALIEKIFHLLSFIPFTGLMNRLLGAALGLFEGGLALGLILFVASRYAWVGSSLATMLLASKVTPWLMKVVNIVMPFLPEALKALKSIIG